MKEANERLSDNERWRIMRKTMKAYEMENDNEEVWNMKTWKRKTMANGEEERRIVMAIHEEEDCVKD